MKYISDEKVLRLRECLLRLARLGYGPFGRKNRKYTICKYCGGDTFDRLDVIGVGLGKIVSGR